MDFYAKITGNNFVSKKLLVSIFISCFLSIQLYEAATSREDYPFTKWGMYSSLPRYKSYFRISFETTIHGKKVNGLRDPWVHDRQITNLIELKEDSSTPGKEIFKIIKEKLTIQKIEILLKQNLSHDHYFDKTKVYFRFWRELKPELINRPDIEHQLYPVLK